MKKLSVLLLAAVVALGASAGVNFKATHAVKSNRVINIEMNKLNTKSLKEKGQMRVITTQPEGELKSYSRTGDCVYVSNGSINAGPQDSFRSDIVYAEDGVVYIKNILAGCGAQYGDSWVEGYIEGKEIHVPLGQSIYWSDYYGADVVLAMGTTSVDGTSLYFDVDDRADEAVYIIDGETISLQGTYANPTGSDYPAYEGYGLACYWTDDNSFGGFNEWNTVLTELEPIIPPDVITEQPEGELATYLRKGISMDMDGFNGLIMNEIDCEMEIVFGENCKVYIHNPLWYKQSLDSWVEGTYDPATGIISVPVGQYLSWDDAYNFGIQLMWGYSRITVNEEGDYYFEYEIDENITEIQYKVDGNRICLIGCKGDPNAEFPNNWVATGLMGIWSDDGYFICLEYDVPVQVTPAPEIYVEIEGDYYIITAVGSGEVHLYLDGQEVENPYTIWRTDEDMYYSFSANAQEEGKEISETVYAEVLVEAIAYPVDYGRWLLMLDESGDEYWYELYLDQYGDYFFDLPVYRSVYGNNVRFYFMINGVPYGSEEDNTVFELGNGNPLCEGVNYYVIPGGYFYTFGLHCDYENGIYYAYCTQGSSTVEPSLTQGDADMDGKVNISDVTTLIDYLLTGNTADISLENADCDQNGKVNISDVTTLIDYLLTGEWPELVTPPDNHEWVDLGLPSGTLWATMNVGATRPEEYGDYFAWSEVEPKDYYDWSTYKWSNGSYMTKYCTNSSYGYNGFVDNKFELDPEDDAAYVNWGPSWRMPTKEQQHELREKCTWTWTTQNGVNGRLVVGPNGNTLFLPAAGHCWYDSLEGAGSGGYYWSRTLYSGYPYNACDLYISSGVVYWYGDYRYNGCSVRPVRVSQN